MPNPFLRGRPPIQKYLMQDTCTLIDPGATAQSDTGGDTASAPAERTVRCGFVDLRRAGATERERGGVQVAPESEVMFRLPIGTVVSAQTLIRFYGRLYSVTHPGSPDHGTALAHYVEAREVPNP